MFRIVCLIIGYLFGCFQTAFIVGKLFGKIDIREHGSGNAGMTNTLRTLGARAGLTVFVLDIIKAIGACLVCSVLFRGSNLFMVGENGYLPMLYAGFGVISGHDFPFYLRFKGGKGAASTLGVIMVFNPVVMAFSYITGLSVLIISKYVSLAALVVFGFFSGATAFLGFRGVFTIEDVLITIAIAGLGFIQHRENIYRLIKGNERKITIGKRNR